VPEVIEAHPGGDVDASLDGGVDGPVEEPGDVLR
jgi:hypothetical protein